MGGGGGMGGGGMGGGYDQGSGQQARFAVLVLTYQRL